MMRKIKQGVRLQASTTSAPRKVSSCFPFANTNYSNLPDSTHIPNEAADSAVL
eukprot:m.204083 g.204083  ORF g.204083 m.204083 type:complete len:53 (-) comp16880_c1_seq2:77-235(-)